MHAQTHGRFKLNQTGFSDIYYLVEENVIRREIRNVPSVVLILMHPLRRTVKIKCGLRI